MIVLWRVTTRCNLSCAYCAYDRRLPFDRKSTDSSLIRSFLNVLAEYQQAPLHTVMVSWLGGEPLLMPELPELTTHATHLGLRISATTNGTSLASPKVRQHLLDHYSELTVSLDSADEVHDMIRDCPGLFHTLRKYVSELSMKRKHEGRPLKLRVNTVLLRSTIGRFPQLAREIAAWGVDELTFNLLGGRDRPEYFPDNRPLPAQFERFAQQLADLRTELAPHGLFISGSSSYMNRLASAIHDIPRPVADCKPGESFLFIDELGFVSPCSFTSRTLGIPITDLRNAADIISLSDRFARARCANRPQDCNNCPSTQVFEKFSHNAA